MIKSPFSKLLGSVKITAYVARHDNLNIETANQFSNEKQQQENIFSKYGLIILIHLWNKLTHLNIQINKYLPIFRFLYGHVCFYASAEEMKLIRWIWSIFNLIVRLFWQKWFCNLLIVSYACSDSISNDRRWVKKIKSLAKTCKN